MANSPRKGSLPAAVRNATRNQAIASDEALIILELGSRVSNGASSSRFLLFERAA
jgi:hypothetical protein